MAARVIYGLARDGDLPKVVARVGTRTGTPIVATLLIVASIMPLALVVSFAWLAESTSLATLGVFALVNVALLRLRFRGVKSDVPHVTVPIWVPVIGVATCVAMIASSIFR